MSYLIFPLFCHGPRQAAGEPQAAVATLLCREDFGQHTVTSTQLPRTVSCTPGVSSAREQVNLVALSVVHNDNIKSYKSGKLHLTCKGRVIVLL